MDIVIDTSAIIAVITNEAAKAQLVTLTMGAQLYAPASIPWEIGNAFSAMFKRNRITIAQANQALASYQQIPIRFINIDLVQAVSIAHHYAIYAYDAYLIACAQSQRCALLTLDAGLRRAAIQAGISLVEIAP